MLAQAKDIVEKNVKNTLKKLALAPKKEERKQRAVVLSSTTNEIEVKEVPYPQMVSAVDGSELPHAVILKVVSTCICGSDRHMIHGRTSAMRGTVIGHEITGQIVELGPDVMNFKEGDIVSVPFNIACGTCRNCTEERYFSTCLKVNDMMPGGAYGYAGMGGWQGGIAEYVMVPFADFNLLRLPSENKTFWDKIEDYALITDVLPTALHGVVTAEVGLGSTVFICGAGPVGLSAANFCFQRGAAVVVVADPHPEKLDQAKSIGCVTIDVKKTSEDEIWKFCKDLLNGEEFDIGIDCVGFEAKRIGHGDEGTTSKIKDTLKWAIGHGSENPTEVLDLLFRVVRSTGKVSVPGVFFSPDPKPVDLSSGMGRYRMGFALAWNKSIYIVGTGQCPVKRYNRNLMKSIQYDRLSVSKLLNTKIISLEEAPEAYKEFNKGVGVKFIIDPHGIIQDHRQKKIA